MTAIPIWLDLNPSTSEEIDPLIGFCWLTPPLHDHNFDEIGFARATSMGCSIEHRQMNWGSLETTYQDPPLFDFGPLERWYNLCDKYGMRKSIALCLVNSNIGIPSMPAGLEYESLNDTRVIDAFCRFLDAVMERFPQIDYISFGNEINYYLEGKPDEVDQYLEFCRQVGDRFRSSHDAKIMTIFGFTGMSESGKEMVGRFLSVSDLIGISTYDLSLYNLSFSQMSSEELFRIFEGYLDLLDNKPFAIVEMAAFSSLGIGGSPGYQARGVDDFFDISLRYGDRMEFACWFSLYDATPGLLGTFAPFLEAFSSAGLLSPSGMPKPAFHQWQFRIQELRSGK